MNLFAPKEKPRMAKSTLLAEVSAAAEIAERLDQLAGQSANLSHAGAVAEAKRQGGDDKEADKALAAIKTDDFEGRTLRAAFNRLVMATKTFNRTSVMRADRMGSYVDGSEEAMSRLGISRASLMLAVIKTLAKEKGLWGEQTSPTSHSAAVAKTKAEFEAACQRITSAITLGDLTIHADLSSQ